MIAECQKRGHKIDPNKMNVLLTPGLHTLATGVNPNKPFNKIHNAYYLKICCWNLYEKYIRGQEGFTKEAIRYIKRVIHTPLFILKIFCN